MLSDQNKPKKKKKKRREREEKKTMMGVEIGVPPRIDVISGLKGIP